jgi:excisionase family DNA binding protein
MTTRNKRLTMTIAEAAERLGIGRNQGYEAARNGQIPTIKIGKRLLVPVTALENKLLNAGGPDRSGKAA